MDPFGFWDSLPIVGSYFAGMPRFVKFLLTAILILVIIIGAGKAMSGQGKIGTKSSKRENKEAKPEEKSPPEHKHHRHHHTSSKADEEKTGTNEEADVSADLFGDSSGGSLDLGLNDESSGSGDISNILSGEPITSDNDLLGSLTNESKDQKAGEATNPEEKKDNKPGGTKEAKERLPSEEGPVGLPEDIEEELEKEDKEAPRTKKRKIRKGPPVEFEEIKLTKTGTKSGTKASNKKSEAPKKKEDSGKEAKRGGGLLSQFFGGIKEKAKPAKKLTKYDIMKMLDEGKSFDEIVDGLEKSGMNHGEARRFFSDIKKKWESERKPLLDKKTELENQRKVIQYQYLKMEIDEKTFQKMMTDIQKKLVDIETKLKFNERMFK